MKILLFFFIGATIFNLGESVQCYNCVDDVDYIPGMPKCSLPFSPHDNNKRCNERGYCMKGIGKFDGEKVVMRQCVPVKEIPNFETKLEAPKEPVKMEFGGFEVTAFVCDTDLCNTAAIKNPHISLAILIFSIILLL